MTVWEAIDHIASTGGAALLYLVSLIVLYYAVFGVLDRRMKAQDARIAVLEEGLSTVTADLRVCEQRRISLIEQLRVCSAKLAKLQAARR